jgi:RNA polymerase sigma factor (sigma-70 family)
LSDEWVTRKSLLMRVKDSSDEKAWDDFVAYYKNFIYHILHRIGMRSADIDDLVQEILIKLWKNLESYDAEKGLFRAWLNTIVRNTAYNYFESAKRRRDLLENERQFAETLRTMPASDLEKIIEDEWSKYITSFALDRLKNIFSGKAIEVFSLSLDGYSTDEIAEKLSLTRDSVYTLRNRVKACFIKEVRALIWEFEGEN